MRADGFYWIKPKQYSDYAMSYFKNGAFYIFGIAHTNVCTNPHFVSELQISAPDSGYDTQSAIHNISSIMCSIYEAEEVAEMTDEYKMKTVVRLIRKLEAEIAASMRMPRCAGVVPPELSD